MNVTSKGAVVQFNPPLTHCNTDNQIMSATVDIEDWVQMHVKHSITEKITVMSVMQLTTDELANLLYKLEQL